ncbi:MULTISPECIES: HEAT repeat domain-containing protein [unclassified Pseudomonas]|uniref:HEAT repeat domain-containing protein n=1 Tax=unclassified Pseudomonas TaxID=196821 RepID=UPI000E6CDDFF|nr:MULTISPECIES: HEAT repeat domain-containing protein [unclassified Pseudomonas]MBX7276674.1 HEAT repeat domain-containing protein [Pseudomonas sp. ERGC3:01]QJI11165.1 HEAT repeat domain-containing protein [Pseudomonas sp. ADAK22]QZC93142.1 HEAT repeat domain-containing protein [Pseudomonas sp. ERGC3:05]
MFKEYEFLLDSIGSEDYWSDVGIDIAASKISQFDNSSWSDLESALLAKSEVWRGRCAESLGDSNDDRALRVLLMLLKAGEESVVIHAIESIESVFLAGYILDRAQVIRALDEGFEAESRTLKLMTATLVRKLSEA